MNLGENDHIKEQIQYKFFKEINDLYYQNSNRYGLCKGYLWLD